MKTLKRSVKLIAILVTVSGALSFAHSFFVNQELYSTQSIEIEEISFESSDEIERFVASGTERQTGYGVQSFSSSRMDNTFNGKWELYKITEGELETEYKGNEQVVNLEVLFSNPVTLSTGEQRFAYKIRINEDNELVYDVSFFNEAGTIALVRSLSKGNLEVLELRKLTEKEALNEILLDTKANEETKKLLGSKGCFGEFKISTAGDPLTRKAVKSILKADKDVSGEVVIYENGQIFINNLYLHKDTSFERGAINLEGEIESTGKSFVLSGDGDDEVRGLIQPLGDRGCKVSFSTGSVQGVWLTALTHDEFEKLPTIKNEIDEEREKSGDLQDLDPELKPRLIAPVAPRQEVEANDYNDKYDNEELTEEYELNQEEVKEYAQENGFDF